MLHLPSQISYSTLHIPHPKQGHVTERGNGDIRIPRRELFDIRMQLMASDEAVNPQALKDSSSTPSLVLLGNDDIQPSLYEGGLKSWECSLDLVSLLAEEEDYLRWGRQDGRGLHVLEVLTI